VTDCFFCRVAAGAARAHIVHEDEAVVAFLDRAPIRPGHVQIIPRAHFPYFDDLPAPVAARILAVGQGLAKSLKAIFGVERVAFLFTGGDIAHAHAHVVPMHDKTDITSRRYIAERALTFRPRPRASESELDEVAARLRGRLAPD
jgi:histidine triad (HIT) family protein